MKRLLHESLADVGGMTIAQARKVVTSAASVWLVIYTGLNPRQWRRTIREAWVRQVIVSGVNALGISCFLAIALGVLLCVQFQLLVGPFNQSQLLPTVFVAAIVRELGPLVVNFILIARSGNAIATELGLMHVSGEVQAIEGQGIDPFAYLVLPRVLGLTFSAVCLTVLFNTTAMLAVYVCGAWVGAKTGSLPDFATGVIGLLSSADMVNLTLKSTVPSLIGGSICCMEGLSAGTTLADVPKAAIRAVQRSVVVLFAASAFISIITYLR